MNRSLDFPSSYLCLRAYSRLALCTIVAALLLSGSLQAQTLKKVPFPFSPIGLNCLPWFVAKDARLSEKYGIDLDPIFIGASSALFQSMLSGAADFSGSGGPAIIANILSGGDVIHVTAMVPRFTQSVMVKPEIKRPEDMANKKIGVSRLGTVTHFALQTALDGYGVKNVTILQMGGQPEAFAGLARGSVDGAVFSPPYNFQLKKQGYNELVSPNDLKKFTDFITNGIVARRSVVEKDKDTVIRVIKVTAEAIKLIQRDKEYTKKVIMKWMPMKDPDLLEQAYLFAAENYAKEGLVNEGALRSMVKQMVQSNLIDAKLAASTPVTAYYDNRYVDEVKRSGFFDQLWR
ncbi:MAG TPA: ABC transporter substrate-binding protein [Candidatus Binatia bacterium]|jgi:ABC-type nitrate/sulfonate/bicarbonate transport system substrate-binding protein|nr:ABC transporter substrate-binding protein [Candidatus Binatia bacterium]